MKNDAERAKTVSKESTHEWKADMEGSNGTPKVETDTKF